jgi:RNA polymerase sigma-B factor
MPSASTTNAQETANTPNAANAPSTQETEKERVAREASEARAERARHRSLHRTPKGKAAWDKDRTRELFRRYKEDGDPEVRASS